MRSSTSAAVGSAVFFLVAPGVVVGLIPWLVSGWSLGGFTPWWAPAQVLGGVLICVGLFVLVSAFVRFVRARGTPAPVAPTEHLVVDGFNRYVRNPMYVAILAALTGQALVFASAGLVIYTVIVAAAFIAFVHVYEEPSLRRQFGAEYDNYRRNVPAWLPRLRPWQAR